MNRDGLLTIGEARKRLGMTRGKARTWLFEMAKRHPDVRLIVERLNEKSGWIWIDPEGLNRIRTGRFAK